MLYAFLKQIQLQNILAQWIKGDNSTGNSQTKVICQTMATAQQLIKQVIDDKLLK